MKDIALITAMSIRNNIRLKIIIAISFTVVLICAISLIVAFCILVIAPEMKAETPDRHTLEISLCVIVYSACLIGLGVNLNAFGFQTMMREKSRGNIISLLATPLEVSHIWIGKSLAIFLPGLILGEILGLISLLAINYVYFVPNIGFLATPWIIISSFVAVPLIYLGLSLLVHLIGLTGKPVTGNVIAQVFLPVFASLMINLGVHHVLDATSWPFALANLGLAVVIIAIVILLRSRLTAERIVLSH
jgi:ABC-2 type transport system permease protein